MVLYVKSLKENIENFMEVTTVLVQVLDTVGAEHQGYEKSMIACKANLGVLNELLAAGITELQVPKVPHRRGPGGFPLDQGEGPN